MEKSHVTMEQKVCPVCGKSFDSGALLLDKRLRPVFERNTVTGYSMCPEHQQKFNEGYVALVVCDETKSSPSGDTLKIEDAYRTGEIIHMRNEAFMKVFNAEPIPMVFIDTKAAAKLKKMAKVEK